MLDYQLEDALKRVLRHHDAPVNREIIDHLGQLFDWVREDELARHIFVSSCSPLSMLVVLSRMGIYGGEAIDKVGTDDSY